MELGRQAVLLQGVEPLQVSGHSVVHRWVSAELGGELTLAVTQLVSHHAASANSILHKCRLSFLDPRPGCLVLLFCWCRFCC